MKKQFKSVLAFLLATTLLFSNGTLTSFAAPGTGEAKKESRQSSQIALYQNGDLSAAYVEGVESEKYTAPAEGTVEAVIYNGMKNFSTQIDVEKFHLNYEQIELAYQQVINSNPDLFYVSNTFKFYRYTGEEEVVALEPGYIATKTQLSQMTSAFDKAVEKALSGIDDTMTQLEKALYLHDYIVKSNAYDYESYENEKVPAVSHSAYGTLVLNTSVCDGYSLAYSYLLGKCGINARLITSASMAHAWNAIEIDGSWYFVDLTNDDPICPFYKWENNDYVLSHKGDDYSLVCHSAFLASEELWRNTEYSNGYYNGWAQTDVKCDNKKYDDAIWKTNENEYGYCDGYWYYLDEEWNQQSYTVDNATIMRTEDPAAAGEVFLSLAEYKDTWAFEDGTWPGIFTKMSVYAPAKKLLFNANSKIYMVDLTDANKTPKVYIDLNDTAYAGLAFVFGLIVLDDYLYFGIQSDPNLDHLKFRQYLGEYTTGDVNGDNMIDSKDALEILKYDVGIGSSDFIAPAANVNGDDVIDSKDALEILKYDVGIIEEFSSVA